MKVIVFRDIYKDNINEKIENGWNDINYNSEKNAIDKIIDKPS